MIRVFVMIVGFFVMYASHSAHAQTSFDGSGANGGSIILGYDSRDCDGTIEGAIRYNSGSSCAEFCDGTAWRCPNSGCAAPASCSNVGDVCSDGSLFAGFVLYSNSSCEPIFVTATTQSTGIQYSSTSLNDSTDDVIDGRTNHNWIVANRTLSDYPAVEMCENLTDHGRSDWYVPTSGEFNVIYANKSAIDANATDPIGSNDFWLSLEWYDEQQHLFYSENASVSATNNTGLNYLRCIRRD